MKEATAIFTADGSYTLDINGIYHAVKVDGTGSVTVSDAFNGSVGTGALYSFKYGISSPVTISATGVSGTLIVTLQWIEI